MSTQNPVIRSFKAGGDLSAGQYKFVKFSADRTVVLCTAITDKVVGILQNKPTAAGQAADVAVAGDSKLMLGATLTAGAYVAPATSAKAQAAVTTQYARAQLTEGGADTEIVDALLIGPWLVA